MNETYKLSLQLSFAATSWFAVRCSAGVVCAHVQVVICRHALAKVCSPRPEVGEGRLGSGPRLRAALFGLVVTLHVILQTPQLSLMKWGEGGGGT